MLFMRPAAAETVHEEYGKITYHRVIVAKPHPRQGLKIPHICAENSNSHPTGSDSSQSDSIGW